MVKETKGDYFKYVLRFLDHGVCPATFHLESYQHTEEACVKDWNHFNKVGLREWEGRS